MVQYPWKLLPQLVRQIELSRKSDAHATTDALLDIFGRQRASLEFRKLRCATILIGCTRGSHHGGASSTTILNRFYAVIERLTRLNSWPAVRRALHRYVDQCLGDVRPVRSTSTELAVARTRKRMTSALDSPRTLEQYAVEFGISSGHLARAFRTITGRTFREELRRCRLEAACRMLSGTSWKIAVITRRIGLQDPSQFIDQFRREIGLTPGEFRKQRHRRRRAASSI
jgi:AraC-like DNA-binding protein